MFLGDEMLVSTTFPESKENIKKWVDAASTGWADINSWIIKLENNVDVLIKARDNSTQDLELLTVWLQEQEKQLQCIQE